MIDFTKPVFLEDCPTALVPFLKEWLDLSNTSFPIATSGSTGVPKEILVTRNQYFNSAKRTNDFLKLDEGNAAFLALPIDKIGGRMMVVRAFERKMKLYSVTPTTNPLLNFKLTEKIHLAAFTPLQIFSILENATTFSSLCFFKHVLIGGGEISQSLLQKIKSFSVDTIFYETYGMTETVSHIALRRLNGADSQSFFVPFENIILSKNEENCLEIIDPLLSEKKIITYDLVDINADGSFKILGRNEEVINSGGIKLYCFSIEEKLKNHLTFPFFITKEKDEKFGEKPVIAIEANSLEDIDFETIKLHFKNVLDKFEMPKVIYLLPTFHFTETHKLIKTINHCTHRIEM